MNVERVLVTGAGGFLGCRLVERLFFEEKVPLRAMVHTPAGSVRLHRLPVETVWADLTDPEQVKQALRGCDVVVHCAVGSAGGRRVARKSTVEGTRILAQESLDPSVKRFVHISTVAVHSYSPPPVITEETALKKCGTPYCDNKIDAESIVSSHIRHKGLPASILRMGNIFGPFSGPWTIRPLAHIGERYITLVDEGRHFSNAVFVDNAVEAILQAINRDQAVGKTFFITDDETTWRDWFGVYASWLGGRPLRSISSEEIINILAPSRSEKMRLILSDLRTLFGSNQAKGLVLQTLDFPNLSELMATIWDYIPQKMQAQTKSYLLRRQVSAGTSHGHEDTLPTAGLLEVYRSKTTFSNRKAKDVLDYKPRVAFNDACSITHEWAKWARLV